MSRDVKDRRQDIAEADESSMRDVILLASARLFADHGFEGTKVRQISDAVGIQMPTIYHYFGSKRGLYEETLLRQQEHARREHESALDPKLSPEDRIRNWMEKDFSFLIENDIWLRLLLHESLDRNEEFRKTLARGNMQRVYDEIRAALNEVALGAGDGELPIMLMSTSLGFAQLRSYSKYIEGYAPAKSSDHEEEQAMINQLMSLICKQSAPVRRRKSTISNREGVEANPDHQKLVDENNALRQAVIDLTLEKMNLMEKLGRTPSANPLTDTAVRGRTTA